MVSEHVVSWVGLQDVVAGALHGQLSSGSCQLGHVGNGAQQTNRNVTYRTVSFLIADGLFEILCIIAISDQI